jgi:uncharacterized membrane protein YjjP (DUF1212 family)
MNESQRKRNRKWLILGGAGLASGLIMLLVFRSITAASGTAAATIAGIIVLKHLALAVAVSSPIAALFQSVKPTLRAYCPWASQGDD